MKRHFLIFVNPISGTKNKANILQLIQIYCQTHHIQLTVEHTRADGNYVHMDDDIKKGLYTDIIIVGGDGTVNQITQYFKQAHLPFGIIPVGSGNGLANSAKIPANVTEGLDVIHNGTAKLIDCFWVNNTYSCMLSGLGLDADVAHRFASKAARGLITYTQQSIISYFKAQPYTFKVTVDEFSFFTDAFFISVANSNQFGNNFKIAPYASLSDGLLDVVIVQRMPKAKLPFAILKQIKGNNKLQAFVEESYQKPVMYFQTPELTIENLKLAPLHIDGEKATTEHNFHIKLQPKAFKLFMP